MRRRVLGNLGLALSVLLGAAPCMAQELQPPVPKLADFSTLPKLPAPAPAEPLLLDENPKADEAKVNLKVSPNTGMPQIDADPDRKVSSLVELAVQSTEYIDPRYIANSQYPDEKGIWERARGGYGEQIRRLVNDYKMFYLSTNLIDVGLVVGVAAPFANTHADQGMRDWYQRQAGVGRSRAADDTANAFKQFGEWKYAIPTYLALSVGEYLFPENPMVGVGSEFGNRSLRALAVGAPMVGILQVGLGSDRPFARDSRWHPGRSSHGVSGHAFVGAVPFLTVASMTDSYALKALMVASSLGPAWSRMHTDDHYFSQVVLGWSIAYLAVEAVNQTESPDSRCRIIPMAFPNGVGMGVLLQY